MQMQAECFTITCVMAAGQGLMTTDLMTTREADFMRIWGATFARSKCPHLIAISALRPKSNALLFTLESCHHNNKTLQIPDGSDIECTRGAVQTPSSPGNIILPQDPQLSVHPCSCLAHLMPAFSLPPPQAAASKRLDHIGNDLTHKQPLWAEYGETAPPEQLQRQRSTTRSQSLHSASLTTTFMASD
jgi:hypothetical protein